MELQYPIINNKDQIIDYKDKESAYKERAMLRAVQVFVYNLKKELFVQKRSKRKLRYPNYFCTSVAGHVEPEESYRQAAVRELQEELGIKKVKNLKFIVKEKTPVGGGVYAMTSFFIISTDEAINLQEEEVDSGNFYPIEKIKQLILKGKPFTPGFLYFFNKFYK